ncbi:MAG TPA: hypothetical protein VGK33_10510 [Chloroflexota bacterium]
MTTVRPFLRKVPEVTFHFWAVKILSTAMGEATSDYLVHTIDPFQAVGLGALGLTIGLAWQLTMRRYFAPAYWFAVVMVAVFGTMVADAIHIEFGIAYAISAFDCAVALAAIFASWYLVERTLSIHSITTRRREVFYWATVLATFAMGTALGDLTAYSMHLGWLVSGLLYTVLFGIPLVARRVAGLNELVAFWFAYIVTRPLGASYADWIGVPKSLGGLNFGRGTVAITLTLVIIAWVAFLAVTKIDVQPRARGRSELTERAT